MHEHNAANSYLLKQYIRRKLNQPGHRDKLVSSPEKKTERHFMDSGRAGCVIQYNASSLKKYLSSEVSSSAMSWIAERLADL